MKRILLAALFAASAAVAQVPAPPAPAQPARPLPADRVDPAKPVDKDAVPTFRATQVLGSKVYLKGEVNAGKVEDIVFDDAGNLEYLIVDNGGKLVTVPWEATTFNVEKKSAVINLTEEKFKVIPTYTTTSYPSFYTPTYRTEVYKYYDITPRDLRRLDRRGR